MKPANSAMLQARASRPVKQKVLIHSSRRRETRVEFAVHLMCPAHGDAFWKSAIGTTCPGSQRSLNLRIEMRDLPTRMHTAVGATSAGNAYRMRADPAQRTLECVLHRTAARLTLPTTEVASVVLDTQGDSLRGP